MSYMGIEGEAGGTVTIRKGEQKGSLVIEIDTEGMAQYLFLDADERLFGEDREDYAETKRGSLNGTRTQRKYKTAIRQTIVAL